MAGEVGSADVVVTADTSIFRDELNTEMRRAGSDAANALDDALQRQLARTGRQAGRTLRREIQDAMRNLEVNIDVAADTKAFRAQMERELRGWEVSVRVTADSAYLRQRIEAATANMAPVEVSFDVDAAGLRQRIAAATSNMPPVTIDVDIDAGLLRERITAATSATPAIQVTFDVDADFLRQRIEAATTGMRAIEVPVVADARLLESQLRVVAGNAAVAAGAQAGNSFSTSMNNSAKGGMGTLTSIVTGSLKLLTAAFIGFGQGAAVGLNAVFSSFGTSSNRVTSAFGRVGMAILGLIGPILLINRLFHPFAGQVTAVRSALLALSTAMNRIPFIGPQLLGVAQAFGLLSRTTGNIPGQTLRIAGGWRSLIVTMGLLLSGLNTVHKTMAKVSKVFTTLSKAGAGFLSMSFAAAQAASTVATLVGTVLAFGAAIGPVFGIVAALPTALLTLAAAGGAVYLAFSGIKKAFEPLKSQFQELRDAVADVAFKAVRDEAAKLGPTLKIVQTGLVGIGGEFGKAVSEAVRFANSMQAQKELPRLFQATQTAMSGLTRGMFNGLSGLLTLSTEIGDAFGKKLGDAIANSGDRFGKWAKNAAESGKAVEWVQKAVDTFKQLGRIFGNIGGTVKGVFSAMNQSGTGLLDTIERLTGQAEKFAKSAKGQEQLLTIFESLGTVGQSLAGVFKPLLDIFVGLAPIAADVATTLGGAFTGAVTTIAPVVVKLGEAFGSLAPIAGQAIGKIAEAVVTLEPTLLGLVDAVGQGWSAIADNITPVAGALKILGDAATPLVAVFGEGLGNAMASFGTVVGNLQQPIGEFSSLLSSLVPLAEQLIAAFANLASTALAPIATGFLEVFNGLMPLITALGDLLTWVLNAATAVAGFNAPLLEWIGVIGGIIAAIYLGTKALALFQAAISLVGLAVTGLRSALFLLSIAFGASWVLILLGALLVLGAAFIVAWKRSETFRNIVIGALNAVRDALQPVIEWFQKVAEFISKAWSDAGDSTSNGVDRILTFLGTLGSKIGEVFTQIPGQIMAGLRAAGEALAQFGPIAVQFLMNLPDLLINAVRTGFEKLRGAMPAIMAGFQDIMKNLPQLIVDGLLLLGNLLVTAFEKIIAFVVPKLPAIAKGIIMFFAALPVLIAAVLFSLGRILIEVVTEALKFLVSLLPGLVIGLMNFFIALPIAIGNLLLGLGALLIRVFQSAIMFLVEALPALIAVLVGFWLTIPERLLVGLLMLGALLVLLFKNAFEFLLAALPALLEALLTFFVMIPSLILSALTLLGQLLFLAFQLAFEFLLALIPGLIQLVINIILGVPALVLNALSSLGSFLSRAFKGAFDTAQGTLTTWVVGLGIWFSLLPDKIVGWLSQMGTKLSKVFSDAWGEVSKALGKLGDDIVGWARGIPGRVVDAIGDLGSVLKNKIEGAWNAVKGAIPGLANGAIVTGPLTALIGEAGPEVVIPLSRPARARQLAEQSGLVRMLQAQGVLGGPRGGTNVNAPMTVNMASNAQDPRVLAHMFASEVTRRLGTGL